MLIPRGHAQNMTILLPAASRHDLSAASRGLGVLSTHAHAPVVADTTVGTGSDKFKDRNCVVAGGGTGGGVTRPSSCTGHEMRVVLGFTRSSKNHPNVRHARASHLLLVKIA